MKNQSQIEGYRILDPEHYAALAMVCGAPAILAERKACTGDRIALVRFSNYRRVLVEDVSGELRYFDLAAEKIEDPRSFVDSAVSAKIFRAADRQAERAAWARVEGY